MECISRKRRVSCLENNYEAIFLPSPMPSQETAQKLYLRDRRRFARQPSLIQLRNYLILTTKCIAQRAHLT